MAHFETVYDARPRLRPSAPSTPARPRPAGNSHRPAPIRPKFSRLDTGQLIRSALLVLLCLGVSQLARAERLKPVGAVAAVQSKL